MTTPDSDDVIIQILSEIEDLIEEIIKAIQEKIEELQSQLKLLNIKFMKLDIYMQGRSSSPLIGLINTLTDLVLELHSGDKTLDNLEMIEKNLTSFESEVNATLPDLILGDIDALMGLLDVSNTFKDVVIDVQANLTQSTTITVTQQTITTVTVMSSEEPTEEPTGEPTSTIH